MYGGAFGRRFDPRGLRQRFKSAEGWLYARPLGFIAAGIKEHEKVGAEFIIEKIGGCGGVMLQAGIQMIWLALYHYYIEQICELEKGYGKRIAVWTMTFGILMSAAMPFSGWGGPGQRFGGWIGIVLILLLYVLFYDAKPLGRQWWKVIVPGLVLSVCAMGREPLELVRRNGAVMVIFLLILGYERGYLRVWNSLLHIGIYGLLTIFSRYSYMAQDRKTGAGIWLLELLLFFSLEGTLFSYHRGFEARAERFQREILGSQYEEIREIYLNMRSWRHDYHNHLQVMKAQLAAGQAEETKRYLNELEENLDSVDTYVKSGNLMTDAILNSKLTLAKQKKIRVNCKAVLPKEISIEDVDLCVLLGNLLDNALEACDVIVAEDRFLRIYMVVNRRQLYISIQNSAKEDLSFNERNYISQKRGSHGLGMKRVKALVDKYEGYLTLANEPGVFAAEVTLPL